MQARQQADFSEGGFAKLAPFFLFFFFFFFFFAFFKYFIFVSFFGYMSPYWFPGLVRHPYGVGGGVLLGSSSGVKTCQAILVTRW